MFANIDFDGLLGKYLSNPPPGYMVGGSANDDQYYVDDDQADIDAFLKFCEEVRHSRKIVPVFDPTSFTMADITRLFKHALLDPDAFCKPPRQNPTFYNQQIYLKNIINSLAPEVCDMYDEIDYDDMDYTVETWDEEWDINKNNSDEKENEKKFIIEYETVPIKRANLDDTNKNDQETSAFAKYMNTLEKLAVVTND
jgi:hypothetical protein